MSPGSNITPFFQSISTGSRFIYLGTISNDIHSLVLICIKINYKFKPNHNSRGKTFIKQVPNIKGTVSSKY